MPLSSACLPFRDTNPLVIFFFFFFLRDVFCRDLFRAGNNNFDITDGFYSPVERCTAFRATNILIIREWEKFLSRERVKYALKNDPFAPASPKDSQERL